MDYLRQLDFEVSEEESEKMDIEEIRLNNYRALVISPGFGVPRDKKETLALLKKNDFGIPVLGICLGHQLLALDQGGSIAPCEFPMHGKVTKLKWSNSELNEHDFPALDIMHYHSWVVDRIPENCEVLARCQKTDYIMGIASRDWKYIGWQFHPESIGTDQGLQLLDWSLKQLGGS